MNHSKYDMFLKTTTTIILATLIPWATWVTRQIIQIESDGPVFSQKDALALKGEMREWTINNFSEKLLQLREGQIRIEIMLANHLNESKQIK